MRTDLIVNFAFDCVFACSSFSAAPFIETEDFRLLPELEQIERYVMSDIPVHR
jgi:hypothetical protein